MATTAANPDLIFVDSNILIYSSSSSSPLHGAAVASLDALAKGGAEFWVSRQVLREYLAVLSRPQPFTPPLPPVALVGDITRFLTQFHVAEDNSAVMSQLLMLLLATPCGGKQIHDANIVATMLAHGIPRLLTNNVADFARFGAWITVVPLVPTP